MSSAPIELAALEGSRGWAAATERSAISEQLARDLNLPEPIARLLIARGFADSASARHFLHPELTHLHDPYAMRGMREAVDRIRRALLAQEPILIYGDYDVDGTVATVLLKTAIERIAAALGVTPDIRYHIPHRIREGYGMRESRIADAAAEGVRLVVSVDTGIRALAAARKQRDSALTSSSPTTIFPTSSTASRTRSPCSIQINRAAPIPAKISAEPPSPSSSRRLSSKAPLVTTRKVVASSIASATKPSRPSSNSSPSPPSPTPSHSPAKTAPSPPSVFSSSATPRSPACALSWSSPASTPRGPFQPPTSASASRRASTPPAVWRSPATSSNSFSPATQPPRALSPRNSTASTTTAAPPNPPRSAKSNSRSKLSSPAPDGLPACLVLDDGSTATTHWHRGVVGILASRVVERTNRPALVIAHEDDVAHGSGRSVLGFHLLDALTAAHEQSNNTLFTRFGGHAHAVGFALPSAHVPLLRESLVRIAAQQLGVTPTAEVLRFDLELCFAEITRDLLDTFEQLAPFGLGNPDPVFVTRRARLLAPPRTLADRHLRLSFEDHDGAARMSGVVWGRRTQWVEIARQQSWSPGDTFDLAYHLRRNWHPDFGGWELEIVALHRLG